MKGLTRALDVFDAWVGRRIERSLTASRIPEPPITSGFAPVSVSPDRIQCGPVRHGGGTYPHCDCCWKYSPVPCTVRHTSPCDRHQCSQDWKQATS